MELKMHKKWFFCSLMLLAAFALCAKNVQPEWIHFGLNEGLSNLQINDINQCDQGFIWLGTNEGLKRFDGEFFTTITSIDYEFLAFSIVKKITIDQDVIWISVSNRGLFKYHIPTNHFDHISIIANGETIKNINQIHINDKEIILSMDRQGVAILGKDNPHNEQKYPGDLYNITASIPFHQDSIYVNKLAVGFVPLNKNESYDVNSDLRPVRRVIDASSPAAYTCDQMVMDGVGAWLACWDNALHYFDLEQKRINSFLLPNEMDISFNSNEIYALAYYQGSILLATKFGELFLFDIQQSSFSPFDLSFFKGKKIYRIFVDKNKLPWLATNYGLYTLKEKNETFRTFDLENVRGEKLQLLSITTWKNVIFLGTNEGLYQMIDGRVSKVSPNYTKDNVASKFENQSIHSLLVYKSNLLIGADKTVFKYNCNNYKAEDLFGGVLIKPEANYFQPNNIEFSKYKTMAIQQTTRGPLLWAAAYGHFVTLHHLEEGWTSYAKYISNLDENLINEITVDESNNLHVLGKRFGYYEKVNPYFISCHEEEFFQAMDFKEQCDYEFISLKADTLWSIENLNGIHSNDFRQLIFHEKDRYLATSAGLYKMNVEEEVSNLPLPYSDIQYCLKRGDKLWLISNGRLINLDLKSEQSKIIGPEESAPAEGFAPAIAAFKDQLILGGKGYVAIGNISELTRHPQQQFSLFVASANTLSNDQQLKTDDDYFEIHEKQGGLMLKYTALCFPSATSLRYEYRIQTVNENWLNNGTNNELILPGLEPGLHEIEIRAVDANKVPLSEIKKISLSITPFLYNNFWFRIFIVLAFLTIIYIIYKYRRNQERKIADMRNNISNDLHDDIGSLLGSISIYSESALNAMDEGNPSRVISIVDKIGTHSRTMIDKMSDIVWSIHAEKDRLEDLSERMRMYAKGLCVASDINFNYSNKIAVKGKLSMEERKNIYLIFKEFMHNSLKYSEAKNIWLNILQVSNKMVFEFIDDGKRI